jgi:hypothetical protein
MEVRCLCRLRHVLLETPRSSSTDGGLLSICTRRAFPWSARATPSSTPCPSNVHGTAAGSRTPSNKFEKVIIRMRIMCEVESEVRERAGVTCGVYSCLLTSCDLWAVDAVATGRGPSFLW